MKPETVPAEIEAARLYALRLTAEEGMAPDYAAALATVRYVKRDHGVTRESGSRRIVRVMKATTCTRVEVCAACGSTDSESAKWRRTVHMERHRQAHDRADHVRECYPELWALLWGEEESAQKP
jgi:hypothetical protein